MNYIYAENWEKFKVLFPEAYEWLSVENMKNEKVDLLVANEFCELTEWQKARLQKLEVALCANLRTT